MDIDLRTFSLLVVIASILQAFAIAFLYAGNKKYRGIGWWLLGSALPAIGFFLMLFRDISSFENIIIILANTLIIGGYIFIYVGVMRFLDKREDIRLVTPVFVIFLIFYFYFTYGSDDITARTAILSVFQAFYLFLTSLALIGEKPRAIAGSAHFIAGLEFLIASFALFRSGYVLVISPVDSFFTATMIQTASFMVYFAGGFLLTIGLIIMVNQRLNADDIESKEYFELFFHMIPDGILILRFDNGTIADINEGFTYLTGFSRDDTIGSSAFDINLWKTRGDLQVVLNEVQRKGFCENFEVLFLRKNGIEITCILSASIITLQDIPHIICVIRDITDRKRAEAALQQANKKLNLLSSITRHDILNAVTVLAGYLELSCDEPEGPKLQDYLHKMNESTNNIRHQIEFTREYQEIGVNTATWHDVRETVQKAGSEFEMKGVTLTIDCRDIEIFADPLLEKVFYNFFDNAFRYAPPFTTISVSCTETEEGLSLIFADDGRGIPEDFRKNLFNRGFGKNTGLGLFLSREILAITGISITENGEEGKGARFEMTVPKGSYRRTKPGNSP
ncbi:MAG: PAS domain S-box protein [Methanomicrobiaceae archaeon]|nr:PAS domain S-box protein [Methanomicrobiaceae archaeon]